jgi:hypothetical protein
VALQPGNRLPVLAQRVKALDFHPLTDVTTFEDLALFPNIVDELRDVDVRDLVPAGYGTNAPIPAVYESGGTTGTPKRAIFMPDWEEQFTAWYATDLLEQPGLRDSGLLMVGPSGPHMFGQIQRRVAALLNSVLFTIDLDCGGSRSWSPAARWIRPRPMSITSSSRPATSCAPRRSPSSPRRHRCCKRSPATTTWST